MTEAAANTLLEFPAPRKCPFEPPSEYADMRATGKPVRVKLYNGTPVWLVTKYADARAVLIDTRFSSDITHPGFPLYAPQMEGTRDFPTLATMDPPRHTALRKVVISEFSVRRMEALRPRIQELVDELIDDLLVAERPVDLAATFSAPLIERVTCTLLGISAEAMQAFTQQVVAAQVRANPVDQTSDPAAQFEQLRTMIGYQLLGMHQYFEHVIEEKERTPADDLLSRVIAKHLVTGEVSRAELANLCFVIYVAGQSPTTAMLNIGIASLLRNPDQLAALRADPGLTAKAVEELVRYHSVLDLLARVATADVEIGGQLIRAGEGVIVPNAAANRDEDVFDAPDQLDIRRSARQHLAFGHGVHQCLGANLARVALEVAYASVFRRIPGLRLAVDAAELTPSMPGPLPEIHNMPVTW